MVETDIITAFDAAAGSYDAWTQVQRDVARALVERAGGAPRTFSMSGREPATSPALQGKNGPAQGLRPSTPRPKCWRG